MKLRNLIGISAVLGMIAIFVGGILLMPPDVETQNTVNRNPYGMSAPYWYGTDANNYPSAFYLAHPTLTGNDTAVGLASTQTLSNKTLASPTITGDTTVTDDTTGGNAIAKSELQGLLKIDMVTIGSMTDGSVETTSYMDDDPASWFGAVGGTADPTDTNDTTNYRVGTTALKLAWLASAVTSDGVTRTITSDDLEANESVGFWLRSSVALSAGDLYLTLVDDGATRYFSVPAVATANMWTWVEVDVSALAGGTGDVVTGVGICISADGATNQAAFNTWIDGMYKWDADDEEGLTQNIIQDGVYSVITWLAATSGTNLTESTDYFVHYQTGNDAIVTITDNSLAVQGVALVAFQ